MISEAASLKELGESVELTAAKIARDLQNCFQNHIIPHHQQDKPLHPETCWLCRQLVGGR